METVEYIDRKTKKKETEIIYGGSILKLFYSEKWYSRFLFNMVLPLIVKFPFVSWLYGILQNTCASKKKIAPFIEKYHVDPSDFEKSVEEFTSFNDFFVRKLKPHARPIVSGKDIAILPADARYLVFPHIEGTEGFFVKGHKFSLEELLQDKELAAKYKDGSMLIARLAPVDYHRFHFPVNCTPNKPELINGFLYSVNPIALRKSIHFITQNKRVMTKLSSQMFGDIVFMEVGATNVGTIINTFTPNENYFKGDEKGYFSFGGSCLILLFEPGKIEFDQDLVKASQKGIETKGLMGDSLGRSLTLNF